MPKPQYFPLFPSLKELKDFRLKNYPHLAEYLSNNADWKNHHWEWAYEFLTYLARNKSEHTFMRFRSDVEKFLLWSFLIKQEPIDSYKKADILAYADFCWQPPLSWITFNNQEKLIYSGGYFEPNSKWAPFRTISFNLLGFALVILYWMLLEHQVDHQLHHRQECALHRKTSSCSFMAI